MMSSTISLPNGRLRAFLEQRVVHNGLPMPRYLALQEQAKAVGWHGLAQVITAPHNPIDDDVGFSPAPPDDLDILIEDGILAQRLQNAKAKGILF